MKTDDSVDFSDIETAVPVNLTLAVGWRSGKNHKIRRIELDRSVDTELRAIVTSTLEDLDIREPEPWTADADLAPETVLVLPVNDEYIGNSPTLGREHTDSFLDTLSDAHLLQKLDASEIPPGDAAFYAIVLGEPGSTVVFIRRSNPQRGLKGGRLLGVLGDKLTRVTKPVFSFDDRVDLVLAESQLYVLSQTVFAAFFRDQKHLAAKIPEWTNTLAAHVKMSAESKSAVIDKVQKDTRLKTRLEAIVNRNHLENISTAELKSAMIDCDLDHEALIGDGGALVFNSDDVPSVLQFLNEDLFSGSLTKEPFRADKKASR